MIKIIVFILTASAIIYCLHMLCLWLERHGYLYYMNKKAGTGFLASTLEMINGVLNPAVKHTIEMKQNQITVDKQKANDDTDKNNYKINFFIKTDRLIVKKPTLDDIDNQFLLQSDPDVMQYIAEGKPREIEKVRQLLIKLIAHQEKHGFSLGSVFEKDTGTFVGRAGLIYLGIDDTQPEIEIGYALLKEHWNKGYATELAIALIDWGFHNLSVDKLVGVTHPNNVRSRHVLEKAGMNYIGIHHCYNNDVAKFEITRI